MKLRELIKQLLDEELNMDDEVMISASSDAYSNEVPIDGIRLGRNGDFGSVSILIVPEATLYTETDS